MKIKKTDKAEQLVFGEIYAPDVPDSHGDFMTAETIKNMAYEFMRKQRLDKVDTEHNHELNGSYIVESFIAREDDTIFIPGSWVVGVKVSDNEWELVKSGELNGFSLDGMGVKVETEIEIEVPERLTGRTDDGTDTAKPHSHPFTVKFDPEGNFVGGETGPAEDGHFHLIKSGTKTEDYQGHGHRFSFIEGVMAVKT